jgi:hypothetical protein
MYTITWITPHGIETISTPRMGTAYRAFMALVRTGAVARLWRNKSLII